MKSYLQDSKHHHEIEGGSRRYTREQGLDNDKHEGKIFSLFLQLRIISQKWAYSLLMLCCLLISTVSGESSSRTS
ncbi:hypothetical protein RCL_jg13935.t1 [Rhizophagus clarus]|uniref:Uncharacterized protein n=1 Tax=Rhizophagus clarus TaxID=94130 RepID=A0A8H3LRC9_9GLOM|nr:hypothetical protein RCL_jg13935.t1 [Rhizophagus clarus]